MTTSVLFYARNVWRTLESKKSSQLWNSVSPFLKNRKKSFSWGRMTCSPFCTYINKLIFYKSTWYSSAQKVLTVSLPPGSVVSRSAFQLRCTLYALRGPNALAILQAFIVSQLLLNRSVGIILDNRKRIHVIIKYRVFILPFKADR
jgi:hypothetical protein